MYALALAVTAAAIGIRWWLDPILLNQLALVTLYGAIMFAVWIGGAAPAVLVATIGYLACSYLFIEPRGLLSVQAPATWVGLLAYAATDGLIISFGLALRGAQHSAREQSARVRRSEHELADFFENASVGLHWVGPDGTILRANRTELEMLGYTEDEYIGHHIGEFHVDGDVIDDMLTRLLRGETLRNYPVRLLAKDGSIRNALIDSNSLFDNDVFVHSRCFTRDVSPYHHAQRLQALLAGIVEGSDDAIASKSLDGIVTSWNAGAQRIFGYSPDEMIGQPIHRIIPPELQNEEIAILERIRNGERIAHFETVRIAKSGERVDVSVSISPLRDADGKIFGASKVAHDITERKRAEDTLRETERRFRTTATELHESENRFRTLADNMSQLAWMADAKGWIFWLNRRWYEYTGTTAAESEGWGWRAVHHPEYVEGVVAKAQHSWDSGEVWEDTFPLRGSDGSYRWFLSRALPIRDDDGHVVRWFGTHTDITEQRAVEETLKEADRRKNEFLATLSHELRNPLAPISNMLEILKRRGRNRHHRLQATEIIERQLGHLVRLVDDLLDVDRITRGKITLRRERVDLATVIYQAKESCQWLLDASDQQLAIELPATPIELNADPVRLAQVLGNLLNNASRYTPAGGHISLTAHIDDDAVVIALSDDGIGIPHESLTRVFELFEQVDDSPERAHIGLGIGLTLAKRLVEMHGGTIEAQSDGRGRGSQFVVRLPILVQDAGQKQATAIADDPICEPRRILVVDDNEDTATSLATLLEIAGHEAHTANDGLAAVAAAARIRPDVMLLDIGLPHKNGYEVCREIRHEPWGADIIMIAITGWGQEDDRRQSDAAGFDSHLIKPIDFAALHALIATPANQRSERAAAGSR